MHGLYPNAAFFGLALVACQKKSFDIDRRRKKQNESEQSFSLGVESLEWVLFLLLLLSVTFSDKSKLDTFSS